MTADHTNLNPFPGLRSFEVHEDYLFFGREQQISELLTRLEQSHFLAVVGTSGSGKSSLIRAGMIPAIQKGQMGQTGQDWRVMLFRPGKDPIGNLLTAVRTHGGVDVDTNIRRDPDTLLHQLQLSKSEHSPNQLIIVDQFEEIFRFNKDIQLQKVSDQAHNFVQLLLKMINQAQSRVFIVLILRSDFLGDCTEFEGLPEAINRGQYLIPRMTLAEKQDAIIKPIHVGGAGISDALLEQLLGDLGDHPDELPILQHALMRTWDYWQSHHLEDEPIDIVHYESIGTMGHALSLHAEEAYFDLESNHDRRVAEVVFKSITDRGSDSRGVRRPTPVHEICTHYELSLEEVRRVANSFRRPDRSFLMPPANVELREDTVLDISHESLMRAWERLIRWVEEETESAQLYLRLAATAALYQEGKAGLWRDPELELALKWREQSKPTVGWAQRYDPSFERAMVFLDHSKKERDFEIESRERQQRRQLKRSRLFAGLMGVVAVIFLLGLLYTLDLYTESEKNKREAIAQQQLAEEERARALEQEQIAREERERAELEKERAQEQERIARDERERAEAEKERAQQQERIARDERERAELEKERAQEQEQLANQQRERAEMEKEKADRLSRLALARTLSFQASRIARGRDAALPALLALQAYRFNVENGGSQFQPDIFHALRLAANELSDGRAHVLTGHRDGVRDIALSSDGNQLFSVSDDGRLFAWDMTEPRPKPSNILNSADRFRTVAVSPENNFVVVGHVSGLIQVIHMNESGNVKQVMGHTGIVSDIAFHPTQSMFASSGSDSLLRIWDISEDGTPELKHEVKTPTRIESVAWSRDQTRIAVGLQDGQILIYLASQPDEPGQILKLEDNTANSVAFSREDNYLISGHLDGSLCVWDLNNPDAEPTRLVGHTSGITHVAIADDNELFASCSYDQSIRIWNLQKPDNEPIVLEGHDQWIWTVAFSPGSGQLLSGSADRTIRVWTTRPDQLTQFICNKVGRNLTEKEWENYIGPDIPYAATCPDVPSSETHSATDESN